MDLKRALSPTRQHASALLAGILAMLGAVHGPARGSETNELDALAAGITFADRLSVHGYADLQYAGDASDEYGSFVQNELSVFVRATTGDERLTACSTTLPLRSRTP